MTPTVHVVAMGLAAVTAFAGALIVAAVGLHLRSDHTEARQVARRARWEPVLLDVLVGDADPAVFADGFVRRHHADALALVAAYALRLDGDSLARLGAAAAPLLPRARRLLGARRADRRAFAVRLLGLLGTAADRPALAHALTDRSPEVAMTAARALARTQDAGFTEALVAALGRFDTWGTNAVASMLTLAGLPAGPALTRAFADPAAPVATRIVCAEALRRLGYFPAAGAAAALVRAPADVPVDLCAAALRLLRDVGGPSEADAVRPVLDNPSEVLRLHAVSALAAISQQPADAARIEHALSDASPWVAQRAARGLIESGRTASLRALAGGTGPRHRVARQALAEAGLTASPVSEETSGETSEAPDIARAARDAVRDAAAAL